jgi:hypothetical protein
MERPTQSWSIPTQGSHSTTFVIANVHGLLGRNLYIFLAVYSRKRG